MTNASDYNVRFADSLEVERTVSIVWHRHRCGPESASDHAGSANQPGSRLSVAPSCTRFSPEHNHPSKRRYWIRDYAQIGSVGQEWSGQAQGGKIKTRWLIKELRKSPWKPRQC